MRALFKLEGGRTYERTDKQTNFKGGTYIRTKKLTQRGDVHTNEQMNEQTNERTNEHIFIFNGIQGGDKNSGRMDVLTYMQLYLFR